VLAEKQILPAVEELASSIEAAAPNLQRPAQHVRASVAHGVGRLLARYVRTLVERDETTQRRIRQLVLALYPDGVPQERYYAWPSLAGRHGVVALKRLVMDKLQTVGAFATDIQNLEP
jgi:hypothetical protein